jgi:hypothetical protein
MTEQTPEPGAETIEPSAAEQQVDDRVEVERPEPEQPQVDEDAAPAVSPPVTTTETTTTTEPASPGE